MSYEGKGYYCVADIDNGKAISAISNIILQFSLFSKSGTLFSETRIEVVRIEWLLKFFAKILTDA